ncbi:UmuC protein [Streptomyces sp. NBRC 110611]|uniref:terpene synthase family protein n=1 Tax=Streptomyces sp. NBRC 110611 TaxID=1621259 RepID=UPI00082DA760|nr:hypothetical protein [Streptomyces sp. NBRC 110611]GAU70368.1 UmuC protein [Streptomyces sp. NBRC 110611]
MVRNITVPTPIQIDFPVSRLDTVSRGWVQERAEQVVRLLRGTPYRHLASSVRACADLTEIVYPLADTEHVKAPAEWLLWVYPLDEYCEKLARSSAEGMRFVEHIFASMTADAPPSEPVGRGMREMWLAARAVMSDAWQQEFLEDLHAYLTTAVRSATELAREPLPSLEEFIAFRRDLSGTKPTVDLVEASAGVRLPDSVRAARSWQTVKACCADVIAWTNCYYSYGREHSEGERHNLVNHFVETAGMDVAAARDEVARMINSRVHEFLDAAAALSADESAAGLSPADRESVSRCVLGLTYWMRGHLDWYLQICPERFSEPERLRADDAFRPEGGRQGHE